MAVNSIKANNPTTKINISVDKVISRARNNAQSSGGAQAARNAVASSGMQSPVQQAVKAEITSKANAMDTAASMTRTSTTPVQMGNGRQGRSVSSSADGQVFQMLGTGGRSGGMSTAGITGSTSGSQSSSSKPSAAQEFKAAQEESRMKSKEAAQQKAEEEKKAAEEKKPTMQEIFDMVQEQTKAMEIVFKAVTPPANDIKDLMPDVPGIQAAAGA